VLEGNSFDKFSTGGLDYYLWLANLFNPDYAIVDGEIKLLIKPGWG